MNYKETVKYLFSQLPMYQRIGKAAYKANLETTIALDNNFENPHKKFKSIHVAGPNGKVSVYHMIASVQQEAGYKVEISKREKFSVVKSRDWTLECMIYELQPVKS